MRKKSTKKIKKPILVEQRVEEILSKPTTEERQKEFFKQIRNILK